jgi:hypothetical protein
MEGQKDRTAHKKRHFILLVFSGVRHFFIHTCMSYSGFLDFVIVQMSGNIL